MATSISERVRRRREIMRASGLRPVQIWVPDSRRPGFGDECRRQSLAVAASDQADLDLDMFLDLALRDIDGEPGT